jgi:hypothetical protein
LLRAPGAPLADFSAGGTAERTGCLPVVAVNIRTLTGNFVVRGDDAVAGFFIG